MRILGKKPKEKETNGQTRGACMDDVKCKKIFTMKSDPLVQLVCNFCSLGISLTGEPGGPLPPAGP